MHSLGRGLFLLVVALAPLPMASNRDWGWSPLATLLGIILLLFALGQLGRRNQPQPIFGDLAVAMAAMGFAIAWGIVQTLPLNLFSAVDPLLGSTAEALGGPSIHRIAADREGSITGLMRLLSYCGVFWLAAQYGRDGKFARQLVWALIISATVVTLYGLAMQLDNGSCIVINIVKAPIGSSCPFSGTFRNASSYATFAAIVAILCLVEIQRRLLRVDPTAMNFQQRFRARLDVLSGVGAVLGAVLVLLIVGLLLSSSKGAAAAFVIACLFTIAILNAAQRRGTWATLVSVLLVASLGLALVGLGGEMLVIRLFQFVAAGDPDRLALYSVSLDAIALHPLAGWGLGSFPGLFSVFQPSNVIPMYDKAHNAYLESLVELGIPAACCLFLAVAIPVGRCVIGIFHRSRDAHYPAMAAGMALLVGIQSLVDFSIQIPAVAVAFSAILGMGWAQSRSSRL